MNKKTIHSYIIEIKNLLVDGKTIQAYRRLDFLDECISGDVKSEDQNCESDVGGSK